MSPAYQGSVAAAVVGRITKPHSDASNSRKNTRINLLGQKKLSIDEQANTGSPTLPVDKNDDLTKLLIHSSADELLAYYRRKVEYLTNDHEIVQRRLDRISDAVSAQESLTLELNQRDREIAELQNALSDMQLYLFQEREHVLRLYAENDRLKIRELDDRRKIQHLLQLSNLGPSEMTYFLKEPVNEQVISTDPNGQQTNQADGMDNLCHELEYNDDDKNNRWVSALAVKPVIPTAPTQGVMEFTASGKTTFKPSAAQRGSTNNGGVQQSTNHSDSHVVSDVQYAAALRELEMTKSTLRSVRTQLEEQTRNAREQIDLLTEDRKAIHLEIDNLRKRNEAKACDAAAQLKRCQDLLHDSTKEFLAQRNQFRQAEKVWIAEREKLCRRCPCKHTTSSVHKRPQKTDSNPLSYEPKSLDEKLQGDVNLESRAWSQLLEDKQTQATKAIDNLETQLDQQQKLANLYREQVIQLEEELIRTREEGVLSKDLYKDQTHKLNERFQLMSQRYQNLERRRHLEMEGYRTDINNLRKKLSEVERQLLKLTLGLTGDMDLPNPPKNVDLSILRQVKQSTQRSGQIMNELKNLKIKMYNLEGELLKM